MKKCVFEIYGACTILEMKRCAKCKFVKTEKEYFAAQSAAKQRLENLGLEAVIMGKGHDAIMTTRPIENKNERGYE